VCFLSFNSFLRFRSSVVLGVFLSFSGLLSSFLSFWRSGLCAFTAKLLLGNAFCLRWHMAFSDLSVVPHSRTFCPVQLFIPFQIFLGG